MKGQKAIVAGIVWMLTYFAALYLLTRFEFSHGAAIGIALVPIVTFVFFVWRYIKGMSALDEVRQRVQFESVVIAFSLSLLLVMALFLIGMAVPIDYDYFGYHFLVLYFVIFYYIGYFVSKRKYGA